MRVPVPVPVVVVVSCVFLCSCVDTVCHHHRHLVSPAVVQQETGRPRSVGRQKVEMNASCCELWEWPRSRPHNPEQRAWPWEWSDLWSRCSQLAWLILRLSGLTVPVAVTPERVKQGE